MWLTKKILVPTDFGEPSQAACDAGLEMAQRFGVPLVLMHTYQIPSANYNVVGVPLAPLADYVQLVEESAQAALNNEAARLKGKGVEITAVLRSGSAWERTLELVRELDIGLIVMGTHGRRGLPRALLGSVTEKVVRLSPVPVLTVHEGAGRAGSG